LLPIHEKTVLHNILKPVLGRKSEVLQTGSPQLPNGWKFGWAIELV